MYPKMQNLLISILLGSLASGVLLKPTAEGLEVEEPRQADFDALDGYLVEKVPDNDNAGQNLHHIRLNINKLAPGIKEAGQMVLAMVETTGDQCSNGLMSILIELQNTGLKIDGQKRIEKIVSYDWREAIASCTLYIKRRFEWSLASDTRSFFRTFHTFPKEMSPDRGYQRVEEIDIYTKLRQLVNESTLSQFEIEEYKTGGEPTIRKDRVKFEQSFEELLVRPCKQIKSNNELLENMMALTFADSRAFKAHSHGYKFQVDLEVQIENMAWTRQICTAIINMDESERTRIFEQSGHINMIQNYINH